MDNIVLTEKGLALRDKLNAGQTMAAFTRFCTSSAEYEQSELETLTELKDSQLESAVTNLEILEDHTMVVSGAVDNKSLQEGYYITLIGLYAKETDGEEILFAVSKVSSPMYMPEKSGALSGMSIRFSIKIENADSVDVTVDPTTAATLGDLNALKKEVLTPTFEDYESDEAPEIPDLDESLKQIKSGNTLEIILQNVKSGFKGVVALLNKKVNKTDYDETVRKLNEDITKKADSNHTHDLSNMINTLSTGTATPQDADYYVSQYTGGGTTTVTYHRRPMNALWAYIKSKADSIYANASHNHDSVYAKSTQLPAYKRATATRVAQSGTVIYNQYGHIVVVEITDIVVTSSQTWTELAIATGLPKPASTNSSYMMTVLEETWMGNCSPGFHMMGTGLYLVVRDVSCANHKINGTMVYAV